MKSILNPHSNTSVRDFTLLFARIVIGLLLITHGYPKLQMLLSGDEIKFMPILGMSPSMALTLAMFAEFICAILVMIGSFTRIASFILVVHFLVVIFLVHGEEPFGNKDLPTMYLTAYLVFLFLGAGKHSIDNLIHRNLQPAKSVS